MKILTRYILAELLKWFLVSLTALTLIILIFFVAREAGRRGLPPMGVIRLFPYFLPTLVIITPSKIARMLPPSTYVRISLSVLVQTSQKSRS